MSLLYLVEQDLARRVGPYYADAAVVGSSALAVTIPTLASSLSLGDPWTGQFMLRRGFLGNTPPAVGGFLASDRVRRITSYTPSSGLLVPDRPWTNPPVTGETVELHYLDPLQELRVALLAGLARCFVVDRATVTLTGTAVERDLTAAVPWITQMGQIFSLEWSYPSLLGVPRPVRWWHEFSRNGHLWISCWPDPFPSSLLVTARRPCSTAVNTAADLATSSAAVTGATNATPIVVTAPGHGFTSGQYLGVVGVTGNLGTNGTWPITVQNASTFTLIGSKGTGTYTGGGVATLNDYAALPTGDTDDLPCSVAYGAAWGHVEAWHLFPDRLSAPAQIGLKAAQQMAADEASRQTAASYHPPTRRDQFAQPFPFWTWSQP